MAEQNSDGDLLRREQAARRAGAVRQLLDTFGWVDVLRTLRDELSHNNVANLSTLTRAQRWARMNACVRLNEAREELAKADASPLT